MILLILAECLRLTFCGTDINGTQRNGHLVDYVPTQSESHILEKGSVVQLFCEIHNSSVELKKTMLEKADDNMAFDVGAKSFLHLDDYEILTEKVPMMKTSSMEDCRVESSMNVLEGGIVSGTEGSIAFSCNNCTFLHNERADWRVGNTERNSTTQTQIYKNAEWNECSAPCGGALYVHDNSSAILTVENSSFVKCNATETRGGGIFALKIAECTMKHSKFIECYCLASSNCGGAEAEIDGISIQVFVENCIFRDGCVHNSTDSDGGGLMNWDAADEVITKNFLLKELIFMLQINLLIHNLLGVFQLKLKE
ncbi:uncharacterized protein MONOS_14778 [Monocercomonoides exilis]|uniref:uncharacterized protein n=1 Tax=Monocercomonoides exilis TaxID=2049356 RepID=UPI0035598BA8|nr:hypothetical protein MONOS_14778 [Monocercomonoides exilis]|eukprot:MONOS_14778.1-p1 / transcript=MONOS_14778.1 / gene=MONOS_14778 / organism=Monocercomonoides_exilis_PA203 / gene_product=unspecified product / transcript_product=unspecified product / location=Mono_scaffold01072:8960-10379(-) / protein_length=311 / sequence_SO=supercontig / SO=protein_coding / is_pseudo=false